MFPALSLHSWYDLIQLIKSLLMCSYSQLTCTWLTASHRIYPWLRMSRSKNNIFVLIIKNSEASNNHMDTMILICCECEHTKWDFMAFCERIHWLLIYWQLLAEGFSNILAKKGSILYYSNQPRSQYQTESTHPYQSKGFTACFDKTRLWSL